MCRTARVALCCAVVACCSLLLISVPSARSEDPPASASPSWQEDRHDWTDAHPDWWDNAWIGERDAADEFDGARVLASAAQEPTADATLAVAADPRAAPTLATNGTVLSWVPSAPVSSYVFVRKVPGTPDEYSVVNGTTLTPPAVPGTSVRYSVRPNVQGGRWAPEVSISYPADPGSEPPPAPQPGADPSAAPTLSVSGTTISWSSVPSVDSFVFVRKVPGQAPEYRIVTGTSITPAPVPGQTVSYGLRTNVQGSAWAREVTISYPASPGQPEEPTPNPSPSPQPSEPAPSPAPVTGGFRFGVVAGSAHSYELSFLRTLGARTARLEFGVGTSASSMASTIDQYARAGIRPLLLAGFYGRLPSTADAQNLAGWARAYGPGGTFWQGKSYPAGTAVTHIEFGNETSYSYQFSDYSLGTYSARAQTYGQRARDAANAIRAANPNVGLLAIADNAVNQQAWVTNMLRAVPNLGDLVSGWTIHPYGPNWASRMDSTITSTRNGGSRDLPLWITEWGLSTDNGRCLDDNYGFDRCMTYSAAASTLSSTLSGLQSRYGRRLGAFYLYQAHDQAATGTSNGRERYFGALQDNGSAKGAYTSAVRAQIAATP